MPLYLGDDFRDVRTQEVRRIQRVLVVYMRNQPSSGSYTHAERNLKVSEFTLLYICVRPGINSNVTVSKLFLYQLLSFMN